MTVVTLAQSINQVLDQALEVRSDVVLIGEDIGRLGGLFRVTDGLLAKYGNQRVIETPVSASAMVGAAFGMAVGGLRPVVEVQSMGFSYAALGQIIGHVGRIRSRSRHRFSAPMVIRIPYGAGTGGGDLHSDSAEALFTHVPGLKVVAPSRPHDAKGLMMAAVEDPDPVVVLEPVRLYRTVKEEVPDELFQVPIGKARVEREGSDVTLISYGAMMRETRDAADNLERDGISAGVVDLRSLVPLDIEGVSESVNRTGRAVVVAEEQRTSGFAGEIVARIQEECFSNLKGRVARVTGLDASVPLRRNQDVYLPSVTQIIDSVRRLLESGEEG